jgi:hypothetical protein
MTSVATRVYGLINSTHASMLAMSYTAGIWDSILANPTDWIVNGNGVSNARIVSAALGDPANDLGLGSESTDHLVIVVDSGVFDNEGLAVYTISYSPNTLPPVAQVICFGAGTRLLTETGYKAIETLTMADKMKTSDGRIVAAKGITFEVPVTTKASAPYRIEAGAFGYKKPSAPIILSPSHKIQIGPHLWTSPEDAAANGNKHVKQFGVGEPMRYYHIECENYLRDNLVAEGLVVESLSAPGVYKGVQVYTWNARLKGYTRISGNSIEKAKKI